MRVFFQQVRGETVARSFRKSEPNWANAMKSSNRRSTPQHVVELAMTSLGDLVEGECPCGAAFEILADGPNPERYLKELGSAKHVPVRCPSCGYVSYSPRPDAAQVQAFYDNQNASDDGDERKYRYYKTGYGTEHVRKRAEDLVDLIRSRMIFPAAPLPRPMRVFDLGCGDGHLVFALNSLGHDAWGADPGGEQIKIGRARGNERIFDSDPIENLARLHAEKRFDAVILFHVLEHIADPNDFLSRIRRAVGTETGLLVAVPNAWYIRLRFAPLVGFRWHGFPNHLHFYSPRALIALLRRTGWAPIDVGGGTHGDPDPEGLARIMFGVQTAALPAFDRFVAGLEENLASCDFWVFAGGGSPERFIDVQPRLSGVESGAITAFG